MKKKSVVILPIAAALASLGGLPAAIGATEGAPQPNSPQADSTNAAPEGQPNVLFNAGTELLSLTVMRDAHGTVIAQHHHSHHSHHSSR